MLIPVVLHSDNDRLETMFGSEIGLAEAETVLQWADVMIADPEFRFWPQTYLKEDCYANHKITF